MTDRYNIITTLMLVDQDVEAVEKSMLEVSKLFELKDNGGLNPDFEFDKVYSQSILIDEIAVEVRDLLKKSRQGIVYYVDDDPGPHQRDDDDPPY